MMQEIRVGFIGAGDIASIHKAALLQVPAVKLTAIYDLDPTKSKQLAADIGAKVCQSAEELVNSAGLDAVYVLTPQPVHYQYAILSLQARKHTFIEKPVSLSQREIAEMIQLSEKNSCLCIPGHNYIHARDLKLAKEMIDSGKLGEVQGLWIFFMVSLPPKIRSRIPGPLREVMIHQFYSTLYLLGKPQSVFAVTSDFAGRGEHNEDQVSVICKMPGGALVTLFASFCAEDLTYDPWTLKYKIVGSRGSASHTWSSSRLSDRPQPVWDLPAYWETFREEDRCFIEDCIRGGKKPSSTLHDALVCLEILDAAEQSIRSGALERLPGGP
jgi:predicted dehydrogenase